MRKALKDYSVKELAKLCGYDKLDNLNKAMEASNKNPYDYNIISIVIKDAHNLNSAIYEYAKKEFGIEEADKWIGTDVWWVSAIENLYLDEMREVCF